jgi:hypothetical protein
MSVMVMRTMSALASMDDAGNDVAASALRVYKFAGLFRF